jgi:uncharacterized protein YaiL (DUF2058 family)
MNLSLRDQLLQAGLVSSKQAQQADRDKRQQARRQPAAAADQQQAAQRKQQQAVAAKVARDQDLNRQRREQREHGARLAEIRQLVEQNRLPPVVSDDYFNFVHRNKVRRIAVDAALRERIMNGAVAIVRYGKFYALVLPEVAARVRERNADSVVTLAAAPEIPAASEDPYAKFQVPDDLMW